MSDAHSLDALVQALRRLPGVGVRSAQRMAFHMLQHDREGAQLLAKSLQDAVGNVRHCALCHTFTEGEICSTCQDPRRDVSKLAVVETPADRLAIEQATGFRGLYFVLQGRLSPLDGIGPHELGLDQLVQRLQEGEVRELIVATNPTVEGEATAHYLAQLARARGVHPSRLAHGVPLGGELEYVDRGTLQHAFGSRIEIPSDK